MSNFVTENITPAKAREYLKSSIGNRPISKVYVRSYADTMKAGGWMLNGVPIVFDTNGHLIDGHHRLHAIIEANIPVRIDVCRGAPSEAFTTYDTGRHRTIGQILAMQGVKNYNMVGSIVNANESLILSGRLYHNNANGPLTFRRSLSDAYELYCKDPEGYNHTASYIRNLEGRCRIIPSSCSGGLYYFLTHTGGYTEQEVKPFFECLYELGSNTVPVAALLRNTIAGSAIGGRKLDMETLWVYIVKAWNVYIKKDKTPKFLRYTKSQESMPELVLR